MVHGYSSFQRQIDNELSLFFGSKHPHRMGVSRNIGTGIASL